MIILSNGHGFDYMVASGALAFDGQGWPWERPLVWSGLIKPDLFTVVIKSLTRHPLEGNLRWWKPWDCVRLIPGGSVNKVGLTNPGIEWWCKEIAPRLDFDRFPLVGSIFGQSDKLDELKEMAEMMSEFALKAIEVNVSCPNTGHTMDKADMVVESVKAVRDVSSLPIIVKVSVDQNYLAIARKLSGVAEAIALNSVPWKTVFPDGEQSPLHKLEERVGGGGGGVSGKPAQRHNWAAVKALALEGFLPVIGPSVMDYEDMYRVREIGAKAVSFGAIHLWKPWAPTSFVEKERS